jgi:hypothetical protein
MTALPATGFAPKRIYFLCLGPPPLKLRDGLDDITSCGTWLFVSMTAIMGRRIKLILPEFWRLTNRRMGV